MKVEIDGIIKEVNSIRIIPGEDARNDFNLFCKDEDLVVQGLHKSLIIRPTTSNSVEFKLE